MRDYTIAAVVSALKVLDTIGEYPGMTLGALARQCGLNKSHTYRILKTLEAQGYVLQDGDKFFLHQRAFLLGQQAKRQWGLARVAKPYLDELAAITRENVHLVVREGLCSVVVDLRESPHPIRMYASIGRKGPLHAGGTPKVLLAHAPAEVLEELLKKPLQAFTNATITNPKHLTKLLAQIRRDGYHVAVGDLDEGAFSVAAPIFGVRGEVIAAVSVAGPIMRFNKEIEQRYIGLVMESAQKISRALRGEIETVAQV